MMSIEVDVARAVDAFAAVVGSFTVKWYDKPYEGWDGLMRPEIDSDDPCHDVCCDGASVTREQVEALRRIGVEVVEVAAATRPP